MHLQNFIKFHQMVHKILSINKISTSIKGHNSVKNKQKVVQSSKSTSCQYQMHIQNCIEIYKSIHMLLNINKILTSINSVKN